MRATQVGIEFDLERTGRCQLGGPHSRAMTPVCVTNQSSPRLRIVADRAGEHLAVAIPGEHLLGEHRIGLVAVDGALAVEFLVGHPIDEANAVFAKKMLAWYRDCQILVGPEGGDE